MLTKEQMDSLPELLERSTPGRRVQFMPDYCPEAVGTPFSDWDMSHDTSVILPDGTRYKGYAHHKHARDAELDGLARELAATVIEQQAEIERLREAAKRLLDNYGFCSDGSDQYREVPVEDIETLSAALGANQ